MAKIPPSPACDALGVAFGEDKEEFLDSLKKIPASSFTNQVAVELFNFLKQRKKFVTWNEMSATLRCIFGATFPADMPHGTIHGGFQKVKMKHARLLRRETPAEIDAFLHQPWRVPKTGSKSSNSSFADVTTDEPFDLWTPKREPREESRDESEPVARSEPLRTSDMVGRSEPMATPDSKKFPGDSFWLRRIICLLVVLIVVLFMVV